MRCRVSGWVGPSFTDLLEFNRLSNFFYDCYVIIKPVRKWRVQNGGGGYGNVLVLRSRHGCRPGSNLFWLGVGGLMLIGQQLRCSVECHGDFFFFLSRSNRILLLEREQSLGATNDDWWRVVFSKIIYTNYQPFKSPTDLRWYPGVEKWNLFYKIIATLSPSSTTYQNWPLIFLSFFLIWTLV